MGKGLDKFLNMMRLNDDDYDEEYDDYDDYNDYNEYDDYEDEPAPVVKRKSFKKSESAPMPIKEAPVPQTTMPAKASSRNNKIIPLKSHSRGMEVCVLRPTAFDDSRDISDVLLTGRAAVVNLEGIDVEVAQRIIDFISGACYSMSGNIQKISNYIFIVTPESIDISGDVQNALTSNNIEVPAFRLNI